MENQYSLIGVDLSSKDGDNSVYITTKSPFIRTTLQDKCSEMCEELKRDIEEGKISLEQYNSLGIPEKLLKSGVSSNFRNACLERDIYLNKIKGEN